MRLPRKTRIHKERQMNNSCATRAGAVAATVAMILLPSLATAGHSALNLEQIGTIDTGGARDLRL